MYYDTSNSLYHKVKSITFEPLNIYEYENFKSIVEPLRKPINYFRKFHVLLSRYFRTCSKFFQYHDKNENC
ncbi:hypothetical protein MM_1400 [Methanosarcina mazei Go1]|uniref:Uncharacterized protein n=1 Tax=Methanosarcina mazei (strain ATCC BAA-159 / DSM 3647 / Goe1 / Go1 / JCM 11833 / OCM 88) TaxID=192952 RepID=Q8PX22_METMA|nr:hypothetical protein MM_1400 [Methanosarcina mazei Go1]